MNEENINIQEMLNFINDPLQIIMLLLIATGLGIVVAWTYYQTYRGFSFSKNFTATIVILTVITALIILVIGDNVARAIGLFGAFSVVRFRTAVKDARDTAFVFFALAVGLSVGTGSVVMGATGTFFISALIFFLYKFDFGGPRKMDYVLNFNVDVKDNNDHKYENIMQSYIKMKNLLAVDSREKGAVLVYKFNIALKRNKSADDLIRELSDVDGVSNVRMVNSKSDLEF